MLALKDILFKTVRRFFPKLNSDFHALPDPRAPRKVVYPLGNLLWLGTLMFTMKLGSRRRIRFKFHRPEFLENLNRLANTGVDTVAYPGTLGDLMVKLDHNALRTVPAKVVHQLIRQRALERWRLRGKWYLVAFDATGVGHSHKRHCEHCLEQTVTTKNSKGKPVTSTLYYHMVLEAKVVTSSGLALSIATEFVENPGPKPDVQDCELKAFYRLAPLVKTLFPQLPICVLLDSKYAGEPTFALCQKHHWQSIIVFKEGSIPTIFAEFKTLKGYTPEQTRQVEYQGASQIYHWINDIDYNGRKLHVLECRETRGDQTTQWVWLTSLRVTAKNCTTLANAGGRQRWKIENQGFNMQKNGGYNLEHAYSQNYAAMKNFYILLQLGHMLSQLMEHGSLLKPVLLKLYGSLRDFTEELREEFRRHGTSETDYEALLAEAYQIRLDTS
jgi:hypothetical protein